MLDTRCWSERSGDPENSGILDDKDLFPLKKEPVLSEAEGGTKGVVFAGRPYICRYFFRYNLYPIPLYLIPYTFIPYTPSVPCYSAHAQYTSRSYTTEIYGFPVHQWFWSSFSF